ncbi:hypothetical protein HanRHA438_Chr06g0248811 [Helianthus annuus]|nr:hypothetical protein HanRHA438_Chr06g0248811 [Helianthus annuus]
MALMELKTQQAIVFPLGAMNLLWFAKLAITTAFLGRLGELELASGSLGFMFANVTGFSILKRFMWCHGAHLWSSLWSQQLQATSQNSCNDGLYLYRSKEVFVCLLPDLIVTSFLCPLKSYLTSQSMTIPIMLTSALAVVLHVPVNIVLAKTRGFEGISMAIWITDLVVVILLAVYVVVVEFRKVEHGKKVGGVNTGSKTGFSC